MISVYALIVFISIKHTQKKSSVWKQTKVKGKSYMLDSDQMEAKLC